MRIVVADDSTVMRRIVIRTLRQAGYDCSDVIEASNGKEAYDVIDELVEKLDRQLKSRQGRRKDKRNHPHAPELNAPLPKVEP